MLFGLKIGPPLFQRFINEILIEFIKKGDVVVYMDDILIANNSLDSHFDTIKKVFDVLIQNKLELRLEKCSPLNTEIELLFRI